MTNRYMIDATASLLDAKHCGHTVRYRIANAEDAMRASSTKSPRMRCAALFDAQSALHSVHDGTLKPNRQVRFELGCVIVRLEDDYQRLSNCYETTGDRLCSPLAEYLIDE